MIKNSLRTYQFQNSYRPKTSGDTNFVEVSSKNSRCSSMVGKQGGLQKLNISHKSNCFHPRIIAHEFIHALGFFHEQNRADRDEFVKINMHNIQCDKRGNFHRKRNSDAFDVPYDYKSIMHYGSHLFSKNGEPTIVPKVNTISLKSNFKKSS